jgi:methylamine dehydrogenase accessory protein MauD
MDSAIEISNALLWVAVVTLGIVVLALVRQIGVLHVRLAPVGALMTGQDLRVGEAAPPFNLTDIQGEPRSIGGPESNGLFTLLFFLSPTCDVCKTLLPALKSIAARESWLRIVLASDGPRDTHEKFIADRELADFPYLLSTELGMTYHVSQLPFAVLIDADGVLRAHGLVNSREHIESLFEASERGLASLQEYFVQEQMQEPLLETHLEPRAVVRHQEGV